MPGLPELPLNVNDPSYDTQRDGTRDKKPVYQTHRGPKQESEEHPKPYISSPDEPLRYAEQSEEPVTPT